MTNGIEDAFKDFEQALDEQFKAMNINENDQEHSPPGARFLLPTPCTSSEESESEDNNDDSDPTSKLIVDYPAPPPSHNPTNELIVEYPPPPSHPNPNPIITTAAAAIAGIPRRPAVDAGGFFSDTAVIPSASTIPPATYNLDGFALHLKNNNKKSVQYWCNERRNKSGDCKVEVRFRKNDGIIDYEHPDLKGTIHSFKCCQKNGVDTGTYDYLEKESFTNNLGDDGDDPKKFKYFANFPVENEMKQRVDAIVSEHLTMQPDAVWTIIKKEMDDKYNGSWSGLYKSQVVDLVRKSRRKLGLGDDISTVTDTKNYRLMTDMTRPFLQHSGVWPHPDGSGEYMRAMIFGNPALISQLKNVQLDIFVDATFDCVPSPFYQCLIVMVYHNETSTYVPVLYALMTHKNETLYWHVFLAVVYCSEWTITARTYTTDFELGLMNQMWRQFGKEGGVKHVGCLFHLKQAWRKYLIEKCKFSSDEIKEAMSIGCLDMLCVIPRVEIEKYGIPFLRSVLEKDADEATLEKWVIFWKYFEKQWLNKISSWNIVEENGDYIEMINRTNNALERYNRCFNGLFPSKPCLLVFVQILEKETCYQEDRLEEIRKWKARPKEHLEPTIPKVNPEYARFKANEEAKAAAAAAKAAKAARKKAPATKK